MPEPWISPLLARRRAASIDALEYAFDATIDRDASVLRAAQSVAFRLRAAAAHDDLVLDWQPRDVRDARARMQASIRVNGRRPPRGAVRLDAGHLVLAARLLQPGENRIALAWEAPIEEAGSALTRFRDPEDGALYVHTLFVPTDASSVFPCFEQPDLKARFSITLQVPSGWEAITNAPLVASEKRCDTQRFRFQPTEPISTYLFAFAAGAFAVAARDGSGARIWVRHSRLGVARVHARSVLHLQDRAIRASTRFFGHRFPFPKRDLVLVPQLPYRGMEHPGVIFLAERDVLLDPSAGAIARFERMQLIFHETAHQWMGNLVTMRSFADLWLKEGFANFIAYRLAARSGEAGFAEVAFQALKAQAYRTDQTPCTTALHQPLAELGDARNLYGPIVYAKAPAVLRQLERMLGPAAFRRGVQTLVRKHAYGVADWRDVLAAFESAWGHSLQRWGATWLRRAGAPRVGWQLVHTKEGRAALRLAQTAAQGSPGASWSLRLALEVAWSNGRVSRCSTLLAKRQQAVSLGADRGGVRHVRLDADGDAYLLPETNAAGMASAEALLALPAPPLARMQAWETLWQSVYDGVLDPARFLSLACARLGPACHPLVVQNVLQHAEVALDRLLPPARAQALAAALEALVLTRLADAARRARMQAARPRAPVPELAMWQDRLLALGRTAAAVEVIEAWAQGDAPCHLRARAALILVVRGAWSVARAQRTLAARAAARPALRLQLQAASIRPSYKERALAQLLADPALPDETTLAAAAALFHPAHADVTAPLLARALQALPRFVRARKIFFVNRWIGVCVGGQNDASALGCVRRLAASERLAPPIRRKLAEAAHELARVVAIRSTPRRHDARAGIPEGIEDSADLSDAPLVRTARDSSDPC